MKKINSLKSQTAKNILTILLIITTILSLCGCENFNMVSTNPLTKSALYFDTLITISIYDSNDSTIIDECFETCKHYENMLSATISDSDISRINNSNDEIITVSDETAMLISDSLYYSELTAGLYDITIYPIIALWDFHGEKNTPPDDNLIQNALAHVGYNKISVTENTIKKQDKHASIELGSIAKGYIADKIAAQLVEKGVTSAIINLGGDIRVIGSKNNNEPFVIGIKDPNNTNDIIAGVKITDSAIATSGTYERCFEYDGKKYHHILSPFDGYPVETDISSVTVITDSSKKADALCTCSILLGSKNALSLIESEKNTEALIKLTNGDLLKSSGIDKYIITPQ